MAEPADELVGSADTGGAGDAGPVPLSSEDLAILGLERGNVVGHTCKVVVLHGTDPGQRLSAADVRNHIAARLSRAPRLTRRLGSDPSGRPAWVVDDAFDVAEHIGQVEGVGHDDVPAVVGTLMARRLPRDRPLWRIDVVERADDDTTVLVWRLHHALADGYTGMRLADAVLWDATGPPLATPASHLDVVGPAPSRPASRRHPWDAVTRAARLSARIPGTVLRELASVRTSAVLDDVAPSDKRSVAFVEVPLDAFELGAKAQAPGTHVTVNDALLAVITGAMRTWLHQRGAPPRRMRAKIPVSLHGSEAHADEASNRDSFFFLDLPLDEPDAVQRLVRISRATSDRKRHRDAETIYHLPLSRHTHWMRSRRLFTFNVSNVRGPGRRLAVMNAPVKDLYSIAEIGLHHAVRFSAVSAAGQLSVSICADSAIVTDIAPLRQAMYEAIDELVAR